MIYIFNLITISLATKNISGIKVKKRYLFVYTVIIGLLMHLISNFFAAKYGSVPLTLRFTFGLSFVFYMAFVLYKHAGKIFACISYAILGMIICIIADNIALSIFIKLGLLNITDTIYNTIHAFAFSFTTLVLAYIVSFVFGKVIAKYSYLQLFNYYNKYTIPIMVIFISTFVFVFYLNMFGGQNVLDHYLTLAFLVIYLVFVIIVSLLFFKSYAREEKAKQQQLALQQLSEYTTSLESLYNDMRKFKHDYVNVLSSMIAYIDDNDMAGLSEYFNANIVPFSNQVKSDSFKLGLLSNLKIKELKGIISSKLIHAQQLGIDVFIDIAEPITKISLNMIELCRVVGILIDNAIEAALQTDNPSLKVGIVNKNNSVVIVVVNSCKDDVPPVYKLSEKGFSTKGENRGLGLHTVKQIVDKTPNVCLDTVIKPPDFTQVLEITNKQ